MPKVSVSANIVAKSSTRQPPSLEAMVASAEAELTALRGWLMSDGTTPPRLAEAGQRLVELGAYLKGAKHG